LVEIEIAFPYREMLIHLFVIIVEVNLAEIFPQGFNPKGQRRFTEDMVVTRIEAESKMGGMDLLQKSFDGVRRVFIDIFNSDHKPHLLSFPHERPPGLETAFEPKFDVPIKFPFFIPRVKDDRLRFKK
jgi:hypothetical protein